MNTSQGNTPDNPQDEKAIVAVIVKTQGVFRSVIVSVPITGSPDPNPEIATEIKAHIPDGEVYDWRQIGTSTRGISKAHVKLYETENYERLS